MRYFDGRFWAPPVQAAPVFVERPPHPTLPLSVAVGALAILVVSLLAGKLLVEVLVEFDWPVIVYVVLLVVIGYGPSLWWCWWVRRRHGHHRMEALGWRFRWSDFGWGPITYLSALACQFTLAAIVLLLDIPISSNVDDVTELDVDRAYLVATVIAAVVAAPLVEELVFRGVVLRGFLSRFAPVVAIVLQGVLFGVAHVDPVRGVGNIGLAIVLSGVGVALGTAAYLTRRIGNTIIAHAIFNGVVMVIVLSGVLDEIGRDIDIDLGALLALAT
jgi:membrane protease YdiL (CAAX protease family)